MMPSTTWKFPVLAVAVTSRRMAYVAMNRPLYLDDLRSWETRRARQSMLRRIVGACTWHGVRAVLVCHGSCGLVPVDFLDRLREAIPQHVDRLETLGLASAREIIGCDQTHPAIAERLIDAYPEVGKHLAPLSLRRTRTDAVRDARPLLSALAIAHAASVAHIMKFG